MERKNMFNAFLAEQGITKIELANKLGIDKGTLYRRIRDDLDFRVNEIEILMGLFGRERVLALLFNKGEC